MIGVRSGGQVRAIVIATRSKGSRAGPIFHAFRKVEAIMSDFDLDAIVQEE